jgi:two-component system capsular synthesis response regulator RcsB
LDVVACVIKALTGEPMENAYIRVAVADDHPVIRLGIEAKIADMPTFHLVGSASNSSELIALLDESSCDVLVTDYAMPGGEYGDGLELLALLRERYPTIAIVVMTGMDRPSVVQAILTQGIENILSKADDMTHLTKVVQAAYAKRRYLSPAVAPLLAAPKLGLTVATLSQREQEVLSLYLGGATINEIASRLERSKQSVSTQKVRGMAKLGFENDADLFKHAAEFGLVPKSIDAAADD